MAMPYATDRESEACPEGCTSQGLSLGFGKPEMPPYWRSVRNRSSLPVTSLWA